MVLEPDRSSPGRARRLVREALCAAGRAEWADAAELAVSELVTNVGLHARTRAEVSVLVDPEQVRVEVRDFNPAPPRQRHYGAQASTGRGMAMVAALAAACGVTPLPDGKVVWFVLREHEELSVAELLTAWDEGRWELPHVEPAELAVTPRSSADLVEVRLLGIPPTLWLAARQHHDGLLRELALYLALHDDARVDLTGAEQARAAFSNPVVAAIEEARRGGTGPVLPVGHPSPLPGAAGPFDLHLPLPVEVGPAAAALQDALDSAEELARQGRLLAFPGQPEVVAVRDWMCEQVQSQLQGIAPLPWHGTAHERFEVAATTRVRDDGFGGALDFVPHSDRGVVAADESNRILAVSAGLAAALGWRVEDLLGRRVVALIPPPLREAHVAGFSRHLSTGQAHVLGVPLTLPVLRADGRELSCRFVVEQRPAPVGRRLYLAWIEPADDQVAVPSW